MSDTEEPRDVAGEAAYWDSLTDQQIETVTADYEEVELVSRHADVVTALADVLVKKVAVAPVWATTIARAVLTSGLVRPAADSVDRREYERVVGILGSSAQQVAAAHLFRQAVLDLVAEWDAEPLDPDTFDDGDRAANGHDRAAELRALIGERL